MTSTITCAYSATASGSITPAALNAAMAAVPLDFDLLAFWGLRVTGDSTATASLVVTRTIVLAMGPSANATATSTLVPGDGSGSPLDTVAVGASGSDYVVPPVVTAPVATIRRASLHAKLGVQAISVSNGGIAYPANTTIQFVGGNPVPGSAPATATPTIVLGVVTGVTVHTPGDYTTVPKAVLVGVGGSLGVLAIRLGVTSIPIDDPGAGYVPPPPAITITPQFKTLCPDGTDQASPVAGWMTQILQSALRTPVVAAVPVVA
jgi:hypothetical protein